MRRLAAPLVAFLVFLASVVPAAATVPDPPIPSFVAASVSAKIEKKSDAYWE